MTHLNGLDGAVCLEVAAVHQIVVVHLILVGAGEPCGAAGDMRIQQVAQRLAGLIGVFGLLAIAGLRAEHHRADITLDQFGVLLEVFFGGLFDFGGGELRLQALHVHHTVAGHTHNHEFAPWLVVVLVLGVLDDDNDVLQNVAGLPFAAIGTRMVDVGEFDHLVDGRGVRGRALRGGRSVGVIDCRRFRSGQRLDVPGLAGRRLCEGVLADLHRGQELLGFEASHRACHGVHRHIIEVETLEDALIGAALVHVGLDETFLVKRKGVGVLHNEFAATNQAGTRTELVAILGLNLVQGNRQILVRGIQVLDQQSEHLLMGRRQQVIGLMAVLQAEDVVAVFLPAVGGLIRLAWQQAGEVHFLGVDGGHFLADDVLDLVQHVQPQRQPGPDAGGRLAQVAGTLQQLVGYHIGVGGVFAQRAQKHSRHTKSIGSHRFQDSATRTHGERRRNKPAERQRLRHNNDHAGFARVLPRCNVMATLCGRGPHPCIFITMVAPHHIAESRKNNKCCGG